MEEKQKKLSLPRGADLEAAKKAAKDAFKSLLHGEINDENSPYAHWLGNIPPKYQHLFFKVFKHKSSAQSKIKAKCLDCTCFERTEITNCTLKHCPLWHARPYQIKK